MMRAFEQPTTIIQREVEAIIEEIGKGGMGIVQKVDEGNGRIYAVKRIKKTNVKAYMREDQQKREIQILKKLQNPYIVKFYDDTSDDKWYKIKMEYLEGKNLREYLLQHRDMDAKARTKFGIKVTLQVLNALGALRAKRIMNRDIKADNIMVLKHKDIRIKMIDLGEARECYGVHNTYFKGTEANMAPEIYFGKQYSDSCDIWSVGTLIFQAFQGNYLLLDPKNQTLKLPFKQDGGKFSDKSYFQQSINKSLILSVELIPSPIRFILRKMLRKDPTKRMIFLKILEYLSEHMNELHDCLDEEELAHEKNLMDELVVQQRMAVRRKQEEGEIGTKIKNLYQLVYTPLKKQLKFVKETPVEVLALLENAIFEVMDAVGEMKALIEEVMGEEDSEVQVGKWIEEYITSKQYEEMCDYQIKLSQLIKIRQRKSVKISDIQVLEVVRQYINKQFRDEEQGQKLLDNLSSFDCSRS